jgi:hypothetical protein
MSINFCHDLKICTTRYGSAGREKEGMKRGREEREREERERERKRKRESVLGRLGWQCVKLSTMRIMARQGQVANKKQNENSYISSFNISSKLVLLTYDIGNRIFTLR